MSAAQLRPLTEVRKDDAPGQAGIQDVTAGPPSTTFQESWQIGESQWGELAKYMITHASPYRIWLLRGPLGAGKTSLVKAWCQQLGISAPVTSPSFSLIQSYPLADDTWLHHADLYRLQSLAEVRTIGLEELLEGTEYCMIEWPDLIEPLLPAGYGQIDIQPGPRPDLRAVRIRLR